MPPTIVDAGRFDGHRAFDALTSDLLVATSMAGWSSTFSWARAGVQFEIVDDSYFDGI